MAAQRATKRRTPVYESRDNTPPAERLRQHRESKVVRGKRDRGQVRDQLLAKLGPGKYGDLLGKLRGVGQ